MQIAFDLIQILKDRKFHSGTQLAQKMRIGRTSVWKAVRYLRSLGLTIHAVKGRGYQLAQHIDLLDSAKILSALAPEMGSYLQQLTVLPVVQSTNDYLLSQIAYGLKPYSFCLSEAQTQGKGRQGKIWQSPFGRNLYLSFYMTLPAMQSISGFSLMIAISTMRALQALYALPAGLGIKWPNDFMYQSKKVGGILVEIQGQSAKQDGIHTIVTGIGLNLDMQGFAEFSSEWTDLQTILQTGIDRNRLAACLINQLLNDLPIFAQVGFEAFYSEWQRYDLLQGKQINILTPTVTECGMYCGINKRGELLIDINGELKAMTYGLVSVRT